MRYFKTFWAAVAVATVMLGGLGCSIDPMPRLLENIEDENLQTRTEAVITLANLNDQRAVTALSSVFEGDDDLVDMAAVALVKKGRELKTDEKPDPIIDGIAQLGNNVHLPERVRARAIWALGEIGDREAIGACKAAAAANLGSGYPAPFVRAQGTEALEKLGYSATGRAFEIPMGTLADQQVTMLPEPANIMEAPE